MSKSSQKRALSVVGKLRIAAVAGVAILFFGLLLKNELVMLLGAAIALPGALISTNVKPDKIFSVRNKETKK